MIIKLLTIVKWFFIVLLIIPLHAQAQTEKPVLNLRQLIEEGLQNNPEILAARQKGEVFKQRVPQAAALEDPMMSVGVVNLPTNFSFRDEDMTMKEFSISQKIPFPGKRSLMKGMAVKEAEAIALEIEETVNRIVKEIKIAYYDLSHIYQAIEVTERNKKLLEDLARIAETRYSVGEGIQLDLLKAQVEVSKMVDELIMLDQKGKALEARLKALLNRPPETPMGSPEEVQFRKFPFSHEELYKMALESNPTLQAMKKMVESKEKAHTLAKWEYLPDFNLRFAYGQRDNSPMMERRDMLSGMIEINIPLYFYWKQSRKVSEARAEVLSLEAQYQAMRNEIQFMIADMIAMVERGERQLELYQTGIIPQASLQVNSAMSAYRVNKADFMTLLDSQMTLYKYELEYHQALTEYEKNVANLEAVVGKRFF
jgi:cobalt-zinc-cadmium efflux system outer membrane protein